MSLNIKQEKILHQE